MSWFTIGTQGTGGAAASHPMQHVKDQLCYQSSGCWIVDSKQIIGIRYSLTTSHPLAYAL